MFEAEEEEREYGEMLYKRCDFLRGEVDRVVTNGLSCERRVGGCGEVLCECSVFLRNAIIDVKECFKLGKESERERERERESCL